MVVFLISPISRLHNSHFPSGILFSTNFIYYYYIGILIFIPYRFCLKNINIIANNTTKTKFFYCFIPILWGRGRGNAIFLMSFYQDTFFCILNLHIIGYVVFFSHFFWNCNFTIRGNGSDIPFYHKVTYCSTML